MVVDPQPAARYQPAEPYINRAAPKSKGLGRVIEKETEEGEKKETRNTKTPAAFFEYFLEPHTKNELSLINTCLKLRKRKRTERELGELEKQST